MRRRVLRAISGLTLLVLAAAMPTGAEAACLSGAQARALIASGQVLPLASIVAGLRGSGRFEIVDGELCARGGGFIYRLTVLGAGGRIGHVIVDAQTGQIVGAVPF